MTVEISKDIPNAIWYYCPNCFQVWYLLNQLTPSRRNVPFIKSRSVNKCLFCENDKIIELNLLEALCSWVINERSCEALFGHRGYYMDTGRYATPIAWHSYYEKELLNFDGNFKQILSKLSNQFKNSNLKLKPEICKSNDATYETSYPIIQNALKTKIPYNNMMQIIFFLEYEGAIQQDGIEFNYCSHCGSTNSLTFKMDEYVCEECGYPDVIICDENCLSFDVELGECETSRFPKECCFILPNGGCPGPRWLEPTCKICGYEWSSSVVNFENPNKIKIEEIINPEYCDFFGIKYSPILTVIDELNKGFTFEEMIYNKISEQGWLVKRGKEKGKSGVYQDVDVLCFRGNKSILVECKRIGSEKTITLNEIFNLFSRMIDLGVNVGFIVTTTQKASKEAQIFSTYYNIRIINIREFLALDLENIKNI